MIARLFNQTFVCLFVLFCFVFQVARNSVHRPAVVLRLPQLQVLDGVDITLEERTRVELLNADSSVRTVQMHARSNA